MNIWFKFCDGCRRDNNWVDFKIYLDTSFLITTCHDHPLVRNGKLEAALTYNKGIIHRDVRKSFSESEVSGCKKDETRSSGSVEYPVIMITPSFLGSLNRYLSKKSEHSGLFRADPKEVCLVLAS